jgi:hypothetical protein
MPMKRLLSRPSYFYICRDKMEICTGQIIDSLGNYSKQIDVVLYD